MKKFILMMAIILVLPFCLVGCVEYDKNKTYLATNEECIISQRGE